MFDETIPFAMQSDLVDKILEDCDEDVVCTRMRLLNLEPAMRDAIIVSDLLNAWQVFYYFFTEQPFDDAYEILAFTPASALLQGTVIGEYRACTLTFMVKNGRPFIIVSDDLQEIRRFSGPKAYKEAILFIDTE
ncbi:hypothetical protein [Methanospirillum sp.]|uniref:hypothetical protein n=1 Tax=Methanospirillum sp. TaxID=45200 RepID=UPI00359FE3FA